MESNERLSIILKTLKLKQNEFSESIGTTQATLSRQLKGIHKIDKQVALAIQAVHGISSDWLLYGKGEMFISNKPDNFKYEEDFDAELMEFRLSTLNHSANSAILLDVLLEILLYLR